MNIGDLVEVSHLRNKTEIGIIVGINKNGVNEVHFEHGVYEIASYWMVVINEYR